VSSLHIPVLDVIVDQAEVVSQLHGSGSGQGRPVVAGDRFVGQQPEQRTKPFAALAAVVQPEVVPNHLVQRGGALVLGLIDDGKDLGLGVGNERVEVGRRQHRRSIQSAEGMGINDISCYMILATNEFVERLGMADGRRAAA
jgi:hypothetical protein